MRDYRYCFRCAFVFVPPEYHLSRSEEHAYYDLHENHVDDPGYRQFLDRVFAPLQDLIAARSTGLDFGCGDGPALASMFAEAGHVVALYDPYYAPDPSVFCRQFDFIVLSEVAEHLSAPGMELDRLWRCLAPGGWLGIMTKRVRDRDAFRTWHYIADPTHIGFFSDTSFRWLADHWSLQGMSARLTFFAPDVVLIGKAV